MDWNKQYRDRILKSPGEDYLSQVGHTEQGQPITQEQFENLFSQIVQILDIGPDDWVLDLCCGNGLFTQRLAKLAKGAVGVDMSAELIDIARSDHAAPNLSYYTADARCIDSLPLASDTRFSKVIMYAALQHFQEDDLRVLLQKLIGLTKPKSVYLIGFIPDFDLADRFYNTPERRAERDRRIADGTDPIGEWWKRDTLRRCAREVGLDCMFEDVPAGLHASCYRFHAVLKRPESEHSG
ncbi:class I SAM-dependent methyltransferase [Maricaulis parjimensis]|uniref:class I SAM-dependent methyltransferase n=1 Tax=Maricaulis parjimensis TaxID=144023 RepID=UPI0019397907|nr:class I SAM-dependent methyltransferase [Maricaulis parjimensis]